MSMPSQPGAAAEACNAQPAVMAGLLQHRALRRQRRDRRASLLRRKQRGASARLRA